MSWCVCLPISETGWKVVLLCSALLAFPFEAMAGWGDSFLHPESRTNILGRGSRQIRAGVEGGITRGALEGIERNGSSRESRNGWSFGMMLDLQGERPIFLRGSVDVEQRNSDHEELGPNCGFCPPESRVEGLWSEQYRLTYLSATPSIGVRPRSGVVRPYARIGPTFSFLGSGKARVRFESREDHLGYEARFTDHADRLELGATGALGLILKAGPTDTSIELRYLQGFNPVRGHSGRTDGRESVPGNRKNRVLSLVAGVGF